MVRSAGGRSQASMPIGSHDEFLELCALSASGLLTEAEQKKLREHLTVCSSCRTAAQQFHSVTDCVIPAIAAGEHRDEADQDSWWSLEASESQFFTRLGVEEARSDLDDEIRSQPYPGSAFQSAIDIAWHHLWSLYAASILLVISLGFAAYRFGTHRGQSAHQASAVQSVSVSRAASANQALLQEQLSDLSHEREVARKQIAQRDRLISEMKRQLDEQSAQLTEIKLAQAKKPPDAGVPKSGHDLARSEDRAELAQKLQTSQLQANALRAQLDSLEAQSSQDRNRVAALQAKVEDLTRALEGKNQSLAEQGQVLAEKDAQVGQQQQLLAHDRDIRELIGARDLYISEVYDVARTGETEKPFGRVFYTKEKSLVFYAYDLNREVGVKSASIFQAWGRRGPDRSQALNLGIFYQDNAAKKRWVLKINDPKTLAQIDAVFVTIEPGGGSRKPSGKPLLFAYLKMEPNHP
jgi:DNA gyrase/topoisomerase IV subunit A